MAAGKEASMPAQAASPIEGAVKTTPSPSAVDIGPRRHHSFLGLAVGSVGVVFGDIGTSPLYAFQAAMGQAAKDPVGRDAVLGVVSLALWAIFLVVTIKYV